MTVQRRSVPVDGQLLSYLDAGPPDGPAVLLVHGLASDARTWLPLMQALADRGLRTVAPDLLGHGQSAKPPIQHDLPGHARTLLHFSRTLALGPATVVGHSLGGAVAMYLGHVFPQSMARLVLISSGGLGKAVHPVLRAAALPGASTVLQALLNERTLPLWRQQAIHRALRLSPQAHENLARIGDNLRGRPARTAFFQTLRSVIAPHGQRGSMIEMRYLASTRPTLVVWSERDPVIPVQHGRDAARAVPGARLIVLPGRSHEPHRRHCAKVAQLIDEFCSANFISAS
ncbi:MAG: putative hydrolase [Frankiales bacterium]|nr:putative hydrolase [Frankiales bacterium]